MAASMFLTMSNTEGSLASVSGLSTANAAGDRPVVAGAASMPLASTAGVSTAGVSTLAEEALALTDAA